MRAKWDQTGERKFEAGVDQAMLYPVDENGAYSHGVPWNGMSAVNEAPTGAEPTAVWADNKKYLNLFSAEEYKATIEAFMYPDEFAECDGSAEVAPGVFIGQQDRKMFGFAYRTLIGNDVKGQSFGYKLHLVYGCQASPSDKNHGTTNENPDVDPMSWEVSTTPVDVPGFKPTATFEIDSTKTSAEKLKAIEDILYGTDGVGEGAGTEARLPLPAEIIEIMKAA